jgi:uncharacterized membrane protein
MDHERGNDFYWREGAYRAHDDWWGGPLHLLVFLLFLIALVAAVVWLVRRLFPVATVQAIAPAAAPAVLAADPAVAALRMRYARGEVSREDFQHTMEDLTGAAAATDSTAAAAAAATTPWPGSPGEEGTEQTAG